MESLMKNNQPVYVFDGKKAPEMNDERFNVDLRQKIRHMVVETKALSRENQQLKKNLKSEANLKQLVDKLTYSFRCERYAKWQECKAKEQERNVHEQELKERNQLLDAS